MISHQVGDHVSELGGRARADRDRRIASTPAMLHSIDGNGRLISVSDAWLTKLGYTREEALGRQSSEFLTPESRDRAVQEVLPSFFRYGRCENVEYQMVCKDGRIIDVLLSAVLEFDPDRQTHVSVAVITDVTALKFAERRLAESEARYRTLIEDQSEFLSLAAPSGELTFVNGAYASLHGKIPEEMIGKNLFDFIPAEGRAAVAQILETAGKTEAGVASSNQIVLPSGERRWIAWTNRALRDQYGQVTAIHSVGRDIEEQVRTEKLLQESESRYRFLTENSSDLVALLDPTGNRYYVSPACRALTGYEPEEMAALRTQDTTHPDDLERVLAALRNGTDDSVVRYRIHRKDGHYVWVETACKPVTIEGKERRVAVVRNIDERVIAEKRLQESETKYRFLAENSADLIMLVTRDGERLYASPACRTILGFEPEEMLSIRSTEAVHPDDAEDILRVLAGDLDDQAYTYRMRRKDGVYIWVEATSRPIEAEGRADQRLVILRNIDRRVAAEKRLKESEARYRLLADNGTDMVFQLDRDLVRRYVSPACREILGYEPEDLIGAKTVDMVHPHDVARLSLAFATLLKGRADRQSVINRIRHRDGRWIWVEAQLRALKDPVSGAPAGIIGALRDIDARKAAEDELADANRRLLALAGEDALTGLSNRRGFDEAVAREYRRAIRSKSSVALIMLDVDLFKAFNDRYGHPAGDDCLRRVSAAIRGSLWRPADVAARYGGEEFAVLLPDTDELGATEIAERIRRAIADLGIEHADAKEKIVTGSAGVAAVAPYEFGGTAGILIELADRALYHAKNFGRNTVVRSSAQSLPSYTASPAA
jgi:diguanylate cyclase (GGDEF)-like protein/PAS domain S-box-containing protein